MERTPPEGTTDAWSMGEGRWVEGKASVRHVKQKLGQNSPTLHSLCGEGLRGSSSPLSPWGRGVGGEAASHYLALYAGMPSSGLPVIPFGDGGLSLKPCRVPRHS